MPVVLREFRVLFQEHNIMASVSSPWTPEDDLLLRNSIEAGASLESLAKGAVAFSRRFTYREFRDRWHSLLYDPDVSAQASAGMAQLELLGANPSSKFGRFDNLKGSEKAPEKRKTGSIRRQYYAMRKRVKNELFNSANLGFMEENNLHSYSRHGHTLQDHVMLNHEAEGDPMLGDCLANNLGFEETDFEILRQAFPETIGSMATDSVNNTANAFHTEGHRANGSGKEEGLYKFPEDVSPMLTNGLGDSFDPNIEMKNDNHMPKGESNKFVKCMDIDESVPSQTCPNGMLLTTAKPEAKQAPTYDSANENNQILSSAFGGKQHFNSPGSDGSASFNTMGFSSPLTRLPLWRTMEDVSAPDMPVDENAESHQVTEETLALPGDSDHGREGSPVILGDRPDGTEFINCSAIQVGEYTDMPDSLLNFSNEDAIFYMDVDAKDKVDDTHDSQLLGSHKDVPEGGLCNAEDVPEGGLCNADASTSLAGKPNLDIASAQLPKELKESSFHSDQQDVCRREIEVQSTSVSHPDSTQHTEGGIVCTLNTEDPEIPCNDDIFLLIHPSTSFAPARLQIATDSVDPLSSCTHEKDGEEGRSTVRKGEDPAQGLQMVGANVLPKFVSPHPPAGCAFKSEPLDTKYPAPLPGQHHKLRISGHSRSMHTALELIGDGVLEEDAKVEFQAFDTQGIYREMPLPVEVGSAKTNDPESMDNSYISDQNNSDSDDDIPYFSDVEAMILEKDLTYAQESRIMSEVAQYQGEGTKKMIIRLEQAARASLQRAMSRQGAIAIFYGRHLKHYIKKTEVTIGRSTADIKVDIDLRTEGPANKISRRQAAIKMGTDGSFSLKNLGANSITLNGKEVAHGHVVALSSSCLIEIREMSFVFEINEKYVRRNLGKLSEKMQK